MWHGIRALAIRCKNAFRHTNSYALVRQELLGSSLNNKPGQIGRVRRRSSFLSGFDSRLSIARSLVEIREAANRGKSDAHSLEQLGFAFVGEAEQVW